MGSEGTKTARKRWTLEGMTALVTGGTRGIGYAIVEEIAGFGGTVYTCSRNQEELDKRLKEWETKGYKVSGSVCDLSSRDQRVELMNKVALVFDGKLNILVNNAASTLLKYATETTAQDYATIMTTNLESPYHLCQLAHPLLQGSGTGSIIFISSMGGVTALPATSIYAASKGAINQLTRNLACEWAKDNIRVNTVAPGGVETTISKQEDMKPSILKAYGKVFAQLPLQRMAEADEISPLVVFLCLPVASYITGQVICADGGYTAGAA